MRLDDFLPLFCKNSKLHLTLSLNNRGDLIPRFHAYCITRFFRVHFFPRELPISVFRDFLLLLRIVRPSLTTFLVLGIFRASLIFAVWRFFSICGF